MSAGNGLRPGHEQDAAAWTRAVFANGDYAGAAMYGAESTWQCHAARAMVRGDAAAFAALAQFADAEAQLHLGAAHWIHGDATTARRVLAALSLPHAQNLVALLDRPRIRVLTQLPWLADTPTDLLGGAAHDPAFELRNVGYGGNDLQNHPYAQVARFVDAGFAPDFFLAAMVEWQQVPPDLQSLPCPIFGHVADHDLHAQTLLPWLHLYDELCVTDRTEWLDVQGLSPARVSSFPKVFGLPGNLPAVPTAARPLDFFVSGTMLDPYHPDKAALMQELLSIADIDLRVVRGFTGAMAYRALLAASKASFTYVRRAGAMPTRGLEALAMGCAVATQEQSVLRLFVGDHSGTIAYGPESRSLAAAVQTLLGDWPHFTAAARRGAAIVREQFAMPKVASQYLRFLAFRAAAPRPERTRIDTRTWCQKRVSVSRTWLPASPAARRRSMQANFRHLGAVLGQQPTAARLLDMARELLCEFAFYTERKQATAAEEALYDDAIKLLRQCERHFPNALVPRFVRLRAELHHGSATARMHALQDAFDTIERDPATWQVDPQDDVMPFDFHGDLFDYRSYLDLVMRAAKGETVPSQAFAQLLLASLAGYVARQTDKPELHARAVDGNPGFARYRLDLARALLAHGGIAGEAQAEQLLLELACGSTEAVAATRLLHDRRPGAALPLLLRRLDEDTLDTQVRTARMFDVERRATAVAVRSAPPTQVASLPLPCQVAVLVPDGGSQGELAALLTDLGGQSLAGRLEIVVAMPPESTFVRDVLVSFGGNLPRHHVVRTAPGATVAARLEACRQVATAPLLTIVAAGDRLRADALSLLADELRQHPAAGLAFGNDGWTARAVAQFDPSLCVALSCWPAFARPLLQRSNAIGLHPMWRRSLHDRHGGFEASFGAATEHEFWLRATATCEVRQLRTLLAISRLDASWRAGRDPAVDPATAARACRLHHRSAPTTFSPQRPLPAALFAPAMVEEAESHARMGIISESVMQEVRQLEAFHGTALLHGDLAVAVRMLEAAIENVPSLLSARLALAQLLAAIGAPGAREVLAAARDCDPYHELVQRRLAAMPVADAGPAVETPRCPPPSQPTARH